MLLAQAKTGWVLWSLLASLPALLAVRGRAQDSTLPQVRYPDPDPGVEWLPTGKKAQVESAGRFRVFHQFQFSDGLKQSGITYVHRPSTTCARSTGPSTTTTATASPPPTWTATGATTSTSSTRSAATSSGRTWAAAPFRNVTARGGRGPGRTASA